jgi:hypothetical protein
MTDDWKSRAVPAVSKFGASLHQPSTRRLELAELDADDYARPAKTQPSNPLHGIPASVYADMRALQCLVEKAPLAAWRIDGLRLPSVANLREHPMAKAARNKKQRRESYEMAWWWMHKAGLAFDAGAPLVVLLVRVSPRPLDSDNLASACKAVRDGIADALEVDDRDPRVSWHYAQERGPHALRVLVVEGPTR